MPKGQPARTPQPTAPRLTEGPYDRAILKTLLIRERDSAAALLALGAYRGHQVNPRRLNPRSAAWRSMQSQARALSPDERRDLENRATVAESWLAKLETADERIVELISDAMVLQRSNGRLDSALLFRVLAPDLDDARKQRSSERALVGYGQLGAEARRRVQREEIVAAVDSARRAKPNASHRQHCATAAKQLKLSESHVRHVVPANVQQRGSNA